MKIIKYYLCVKVNTGTETEPEYIDLLSAVEMPWNEGNEAIAKAEAYKGEYTIEDDGVPEPVVNSTLENRVESLETDSTEMKEALEMILSGVTE